MLFTRLGRNGLSWCAIGGTLEMNISQSALAALCHQQLLSVFGDIPHVLTRFSFGHYRSQGYPDNDVFTTLAGHVPAGAALPVLGLVFAQVTEIHQRIQTGIAFQVHAAPAPAIAAIRAAILDIFLTPERGRTAAAIAGGH